MATPLRERVGVPPYLRDTLNQGTVQYLRNTVTFADTTAKTLGTLPGNAEIIDIKVDVTTAFNSSGTDLLDVGKTGTANHYINDLDVSATGRKAPTLSNLGTVGVVGTAVIATYVQSVADATAGAATITILYTQA